ncbi:MAG: rhodanese-like domain-containing protein [Acidobacteria bacterium]|nr:rhodanese-like domain-containing protein [Acidobacteriota bacterium]
MRSVTTTLALMLLASFAFAQQARFPTDPKTGRAIGAKLMTPEELRSHIDKNTKTLIIDVRDPEDFQKETIKGAINIPLPQLEPRLKDIPKDTTLVFT